MEKDKGALFRKFGLATIAALYFLILVGGIVRASGSGMGCPDWPKCFGQWIPPTSEAELPPNYQEIYSIKGEAIEPFVAFKTWTEYLNRLVGAIIGLLVAITAFLSVRYWKSDKVIPFLSISAFLLTGFQGWLGSVVVSTNLSGFMITLHMYVAFLITALVIIAIYRSFKDRINLLPQQRPGLYNYVWVIAMVLFLAQVAMGTQLREGINEVAKHFSYHNRWEWVDQVGSIFAIHRSFSWLVLASFVYMGYLGLKKGRFIKNLTVLVLGSLFVQIISGIVLSYFGFPAVLQPVHLLFSSIMFGGLIVLLLANNHTTAKAPISDTTSVQPLKEVQPL